jgi:hypothetical protein
VRFVFAGTGDITVEKTGAGGLAFEVILAPAASEEGPRPPSPTTKEKRESLSQADIERKLKEAEERRLVRYFMLFLLLLFFLFTNADIHLLYYM